MSVFSTKHIAVPVYVMAASILISVLLVGYILRENAQHQKDLIQQRTELIQFLRVEVCERLLLRDEIQIQYLAAAVLRYQDDDPEYAAQLQTAVQALQFTKNGCASELPE
jgi:hypothetical protein